MDCITVVSHGIPFNVKLVKQGEKWGRDNCLTHDKADPLVEFYDARYTKLDPLGQFISNYYLSTLMNTQWGDCREGLNLYGGEPDWYIDKQGMTEVFEWLEAK